MGAVRAVTAEEAARLVEARFAGRAQGEHGAEVLVEVRDGQDGATLALVGGPAAATSPTSLDPVGAAAPLPIFYSPLKHLGVLSLQPLRLDFGPRSVTPASHPDGRSKRAAAALLSPPGSRDETLLQAVTTINGSRLALHDWRTSPRASSAASTGFLAVLRKAGLLITTAVHLVLSLVVAIISFRLPVLGSFAELSSFGRQLDTRLSQTLSLVPTFSSFRHDLRASSTAEAQYVAAHATYIHFFNLLWLLANDFIIGVALALYVRDNAAPIKRLTSQLVEVHVLAYLRDLLDWLNSWPMGVKLNDEVAGVICRSFLFLSQIWEDVVLAPVLSHLPVTLIGCAGFLGASSLLALTADLVALLTLPFFACYVVATLVYSASLRSLSALFNVFRGRKYNPLRSRVEPASYDVDALLLGTILFVTLSFVFPTLAAFYAAFASSRLFILAVETALLMGVAALNAFPLFALLLRVKAPGRLPGGIQLDACEDSAHWPAPHLHLKNQPLSSRIFGDLFSPQAGLSLLGRLCTGRVVWSSATLPAAGTRS
ncbi:pig-Q [Rhodotorula kratochvilovae]